MNGRRIYWPRGKTLGGSSAINGLIYIRGQREDYDHWAALGNPGWGYDDVLPYFIRSESNQRGAGLFHGDDGPLKVSDIGDRDELIEAFIAGANQIGVPRTDDFNGAAQFGAGYYQLTTHQGWRWSTAKAYLAPARRRPNLVVQTDAFAAGIVFEGRRAVGVRYRHGGVMKTASCRAEVLLSAGCDPVAAVAAALRHRAARAPRSLRHSGRVRIARRRREPTGPSADARQLRVHAADHDQRCAQLMARPRQARLQWLLFRSGALAVGINQGGCFMHALKDANGKPVAATPDIQFHVATLSADMAGGQVHPYSGFTFSVCQLRPESRGHIRIRSTDPFEPPEMQPTTSRPISTGRPPWPPCARRVRSPRRPRCALTSSAKSSPARMRRATPSCSNTAATTGATIFHPSGTCAMGSHAGESLMHGCACTASRA